MIRTTMTPEQEQWMATQIPPAPDVFLCAYPRCCGEWRVVASLTAAEYAAHPPEWWQRQCIERYPSTMLVKVYTSNAPAEARVSRSLQPDVGTQNQKGGET